MKNILIILFIFLFIECEKIDTIRDTDEIKVSYEIIPEGDISVNRIEFKTASFISIGENNPILPWYRNTATTYKCLADPVWLKAISHDAPKRTSLQFIIYVNDDVVADSTFYSNGIICGGTLTHQIIW